jgi:FkbM family methyltransferase
VSILNTLRFITGHPLNRGNFPGALLRFARWQVGARLVPGPVVFEWINGARLLVRTGETGLTGNIYTGLHDFPEMGFLLHMLRPDDLFVDVGANVGSYTVLACAAAGARGVAFEAVPGTCERLVENVRLNHLEHRVRCLNNAVGQRVGSIGVTRYGSAQDRVLAAGERHDNAVTVPLTTLDAALAGESPVLAKIDVEGYETPVLLGAEQTLKKPSLLAAIIELNGAGNYHYGYDEARILELMSDHGFRTCSYHPLRRSLAELDGKDPDSCNSLFVRDLPQVRERIRSAPAVSIHGRTF